MAVVENKVSDISGQSREVQTVTFSLDDSDYEIDLTRSELGELEGLLKQYVAVARRTRVNGISVRVVTPLTEGRDQIKAMRAWLLANNYPVGKRGEIAPELHEAYHKRIPNPKVSSQ